MAGVVARTRSTRRSAKLCDVAGQPAGYRRASGDRSADRTVGADVGPLAKLGVPCVGYVPDGARYFDVHHSAADTLSSVHPRELELGALCMAQLCYEVAEMQTRLEPIVPALAPQAGH